MFPAVGNLSEWQMLQATVPYGTWMAEDYFAGCLDLLDLTAFGCGGLACWVAGLKIDRERQGKAATSLSPELLLELPGARAFSDLRLACDALRTIPSGGLIIGIMSSLPCELKDTGKPLEIPKLPESGMPTTKITLPVSPIQPRFQGDFMTLLETCDGQPYWLHANRSWREITLQDGKKYRRPGWVYHTPFCRSPHIMG